MNRRALPTGRPAVRREQRPANHLAADLPAALVATDTPPVVSTTVRARPHRRGLRRLSDQLSDRDRQILDSLHRLRLLQATQIERLHFREGSALTQARRARATLARLHDLAVVSRLERRIGGVHAGSAGFIYRLSPTGRRLLELAGPDGGRRRSLAEPTVRFQEHVLAVAELAVQLSEADRRGILQLLQFEAEPSCWRRFLGSGGESLTLKPDAFVVTGADDYDQLCFVEVDLDTEGMATIRRKAEVYRRYAGSGREQAAHEVFPRVVFLAASERRRRLLLSTLHGLPDGTALFMVGPLDAPLAVLVGGAQ